jgi:predicted glycosyltransferase
MWNIPHVTIGRHGGSSKIGKVFNLAQRSSQLIACVWGQKIDLAVSHGSRSQIVAARMLGIPSVAMDDYEYSEAWIANSLATWILMPKHIPEKRLQALGFCMRKLRRYSGYKEELYLPYFKPDPAFRASIGVPKGKMLVTIRPSAMYANYHDPLSEQILLKVIEKVLETPDAWPLIVSRIEKDKNFIRARFGDQVHFLEKAVDGLQLIWNSDVFISGGGTMNREAGLLGVPVYSIFTGRKPYLDEYLAERGRLAFIDTLEKVSQIKIAKRDKPATFVPEQPELVKTVVDILMSLRTV